MQNPLFGRVTEILNPRLSHIMYQWASVRFFVIPVPEGWVRRGQVKNLLSESTSIPVECTNLRIKGFDIFRRDFRRGIASC